MKKTVKIGYVGLGRRGYACLEECLIRMADVEIVYLCDTREESLMKAKALYEKFEKPVPKLTASFDEVINDPEIDAVIIMTGWEGRVEMAIASMRAGKYTGIEVGCAQTVDECWDLIRTYEETGVQVMMLENSCYEKRLMMLLNMAKQGLFGEIAHVTGGYQHYLNEDELFKDVENDEVTHYRLKYYIEQNRESYPTHELGPLAKILNINRGNRFVRLNSVASKSCGLKAYAKRHLGENSKFANMDYKQGDIVNTILTCENGETVLLTLDTTLPRPFYSQNISIRGTNAMFYEDTHSVYFEDMNEARRQTPKHKIEENEDEYYEKYEHPLTREFDQNKNAGGHGGLDWFVFRAFVESVKAGITPPIDAYDTATLLAVGALSAESIENGGAPVEFPDFTRGKWADREPDPQGKYSLTRVVEDKEMKLYNEGDII